VQQHHDRVALMIRVLKSLGIFRSYAEVFLPQLKKVAAEEFFWADRSSWRMQRRGELMVTVQSLRILGWMLLISRYCRT
jgi:hypothetical protein